MKSKKARVALLPALMLWACGPTQSPQEDAAPPPSTAPTVDASADAQADARPGQLPAPKADVADDGSPDLTPPALTPEAERGVEGARNVLLSFARAIEQRVYGQAWALLSAADQRKWSRADFAAMFADLADTSVAIPTGTMEGAAGSLYYTAPVTITGSDRQGRPIRIEGEAVLRRVNDVEGATPAQLRWHFETLTLAWTH